MSTPRFDPCHPDSQKCVSSLNDTGYPAMEPVSFGCTADEAFTVVRQVVEAQPRTSVDEVDGRYLRATFTTRIMRFKDEVQVEVDPEQQLVHFKSRSTLAWARDDLNANRDRMEDLTRQIRAAMP